MSKKIRVISINTEESWPQFFAGCAMVFFMVYGALAVFVPPIVTIVRHNRHLFGG